MNDVVSIRRQNLATIAKEFPSVTALAEVLGRKPQNIGTMIGGTKPFGNRLARDFERILGLPNGWIDTENPPDPCIQIGQPEIIENPGMRHVPSRARVSNLPLEIPKLNFSKVNIVHRNEFVDMLRFQNSWLFSQPVATDNPDALRIVTAMGDEMSPTIKRGDIVLLDISQDRITSNGVYAFNYSGTLSFSRTQLLPDGEYDLLFDNERYRTKHYSPQELVVLGRCLLSFNLNPL